MTRTFDGLVTCPHCGKSHTAETAFERWIRNNKALDSRQAGIVRFDLDVLLHKYITHTDKRGRRDIQAMMFIEAKTHWADVSDSQKDTLPLLSQVMRNRRPNIHRRRRGRHAVDHAAPCKAHSRMQNREICLRMFGGHLLQMEGESPDDGGRIMWDYKPITEEALVALLRFELDPDSLTPIDWRRRYSSFKEHKRQGKLFRECVCLNEIE